MRRHHPARPAPRRPEIDQQRQVRARGVQFEVARVEHDRLRGEQRLAAAAAVRPVAEAFAGYAIERAAVRAGEIERHVHAPAASRLSSPSRTRPSPSTTVTATSMPWRTLWVTTRSEEHTSELQSLMRISYAVFCLKKKNNKKSQKNSDI